MIFVVECVVDTALLKHRDRAKLNRIYPGLVVPLTKLSVKVFDQLHLGFFWVGDLLGLP